MRAIKNTLYAAIIAGALVVGAPKSNSATINRTKPMPESIVKDSVKAGVVKNSNMVKVEYNGKAAIVQLKDILLDLGVASLGRTYRTEARMVPDLQIKTKSMEINGGLAIVISGTEGVILLYTDKEMKNFVYSGIKTSVVFKGEMEERFNSGNEDTKGIQRPALVENSQFGIHWVSYNKNNGLYSLNYVPHSRPLLASASFEGGSSTRKWEFVLSEDGKKLQVDDNGKAIVTTWTYDKVGENGDNINSLVKSEMQRSVNGLGLNIIEDTRGMAGKDIYVELSSEQMRKYFGLNGNWNSDEIVKPLSNIFRGSDEFIRHVLIAKGGIGMVEVPLIGDYVRAYALFGMPYDANANNPRDPKYIYAINSTGKLFGCVEAVSKDAKKHNLAAYYLPGGFVFKVEMDATGRDIRQLIANEKGVDALDHSGNMVSDIKISPLEVRVGGSK